MKHYLVEIDKQLIVCSGKNMAEAHSKAVATHSFSKIKIIAEVSDVIDLLKPYIILHNHNQTHHTT